MFNENEKVLDVKPMTRACTGCHLNEALKLKDPTAYDKWKRIHFC